MAIILGTELNLFQRFLDTTGLSLKQWLVCIAVGFTVVIVSEIRKFFLRRRAEPAETEEPAPAAPAPAS